MTSKYTITISEDRIVISPQIKGVEIEANLNEGLWIARDGYNAKSVESLDEAIREVEEAIGYYADGDYEIVVDNVAAKLDSVMTSAEVCEAFALSESAVRKAIERDTIPARKSAGTWLIRRADAEARWGGEPVHSTRPYLEERAEKPIGESIPARVIYSHNDQFPAGWDTQQVYRLRPGVFRVVRSVNGYNPRSGLIEGTRESVTIYSFVSDPEPPKEGDEYQGLFK